jgi:hypothetical protein
MILSPLDPRQRVIVNPFADVERVRSTGTTLPASREHAYALAEALAKLGHVVLGAVPLISFEWLQRPENVLAGHMRWSDYRPPEQPNAVRIDHHKTGAKVWQPLEDSRGRFYPDLEDYLKRVPRIGLPIVLLQPQRGPKSEETGARAPRLYSLEHARHLVQEARALAKLPKHVTMAACRHGGMTELGNANLTEAQIMALSAHETPQAARLYVKKTDEQRLAAARRRREHVKAHSKSRRKSKMDALGMSELETMAREVAEASETRAAIAREIVARARGEAAESRNSESERGV